MKTHYVVTTSDGYWGKGDTLDAAIANVSKQGSRKRASATIAIITNLGDRDTVEVNGYGHLLYPERAGRPVYIKVRSLGSIVTETNK